MIFLITLAFGLDCVGQKTSKDTIIYGADGAAKEILYGSIRTDGYNNITLGAFWGTRHEAKVVYDGGEPEGYSSFTLATDCFVRFKDGEHNSKDINYIVFPKGARVYMDNNTHQFYSAKCGNKIEYIRPVDRVVFVERRVEVPALVPTLPQEDVRTGKVLDYGGGNQTKLDNIIPKTPAKEKLVIKIKWGKVSLTVGVLALLTKAAFMIFQPHHSGSGTPGGAPITIPSGGPGGAYTTP